MRYLKKILFYLMIILTFTISFSNEENRITIYERENEPAKLKIGVTKLITKELAMDFDPEKKIIYCEVPEEVTENDSIYVSETLDEIPSTSTTNGRKTINNINKYLTKDVKANANFNYKVVDVNDEATGEVKKYLVINCKNPVTSVYLYIVENGTYKMKGLYRGKFAVLNSVKEEKNYGTIEITENIFDRHEYRRISATGSNTAIISKLSQFGVKDEEASKHIQVSNYPKRLDNGTKFVTTLHPNPHYKIEIYDGKTKELLNGKGLDAFKLTGKNKNEINASFTLDNKVANGATKIHFETADSTEKDKKEYYYIDIVQPSPYEEIDYDIVITYGEYYLNKFDKNNREVHKFNLKIKPQVKPILPEGTKGTLYLKNLKKDDIAGEDKVIFNGEFIKTDNYFVSPTEFRGDKVKILDYSNPNYNAMFPEGNENFLRISYKSRANEGRIMTWKKTIKFDSESIKNNNINITEQIFKDAEKGENDTGLGKAVGIYDINGKYLADIIITGNGEKGEEKYFDLKFTSSGWTNLHKEVAGTITFEYVTKGEKETVLKEDILELFIYPVDEVLPPETHGTLFIKSSAGLPGKDFFIKDGVLTMDFKDGEFFEPATTISVNGELPKFFAVNNKKNELGHWLNLAEDEKLELRITRSSKEDTIGTTFEDIEDKGTKERYTTGAFNPTGGHNGGWADLKSNSNKTVGYIYISCGGITDNKDSITLGFREDHTAIKQEANLHWGSRDKGVYEKFNFDYILKKGKEEKILKTDVLEVIIQREDISTNSTITLANPLVYYDYDSSSAISNIVHNRRVHISSETPKTLSKDGANFIKNRDLDGNEWIETKNISDYEWERLGKHKLSITRGADEVIKNTDEFGKTQSSTYLSGDNSTNGNKNEIMFSYDGGNKYLNFGVSKYNFEKETISNVVITHFNGEGKYLEERQVYTIEIPKFEGIHYMGNYDISPRESYTKDYVYNQDLSNKKPVIIDYGRIGFRNLDTRITNQSGGEGIDFRATRKVKLVSEDGTYVIKGAELYFEKEETDDNNKTTLFKGENEKATSAMLKLKIPAQETLIPKGRFTILTDDETNPEKDNKIPVRIGITVGTNKEDYYTYIDGTKKGQPNDENLYLNITTNRYIETTIEFENPALTTEGNRWVRLNKSDYPFGELTKPIGDSLLWGRVRGEVIDIPVEHNGKKYDNLILKVFQENPDGSESQPIELTNSQVNFAIPAEPNKNFVMRYNKGDNFIEFSLDKGYDNNIKNREDIVFYIRYIDGSKEEDKGFLFDQKYIVKFKEKVEYKGDITVRFKNPSMAKIDINNEVKGIIDLITKSYVTGGNHDTTIDSIDWVDIGISQDTINKIKEDFTGDNYTLTNIENGNNAKDLIIQLDKNQLKIALPNDRFSDVFGESYDGKKEIDTSFQLQFANSNENNSKAYRLNIIIDKFDPKYYGKVFQAIDDTSEDPDKDKNGKYTYKELNNIGDGAINLTETNVKPDGFVYVDLNTSYRDYLRYKALPTVLLKGGDLKITLPKDVEAIPRNSNYAKPVKGDIVLLDETDPKNKYKDEKEVDPTKDGTNIPKNYPLKLKLSLVEYQKLRPYTKYEIYKNGNYNVLTIGANNLEDNIIMDKPLNFYANGPILEIINGILDFGKIVPENLPNKLNSISGTTNQKATINTDNKRESRSITITLNPLDNNLGNITRDLELEGDVTWIKQLSVSGQPMENGGTLKVRDLAVEKSSTTEGTEATNQTVVETYDVSGILEVPKNIERSKYGSYEGTIILHYTFY